MPLSDAEKLSCFEILEGFWADTATIHNGFGVQLTLTQLDTLKNDISTRLAALDAASVIKVQAIVSEWDNVKFAAMDLQAGTTGGVTGVNLDFAKVQARLRFLLQTYVPVMHMVEALKRQNGPTGEVSAQIGVMRC
jgi:hypothetical protein